MVAMLLRQAEMDVAHAGRVASDARPPYTHHHYHPASPHRHSDSFSSRPCLSAGPQPQQPQQQATAASRLLLRGTLVLRTAETAGEASAASARREFAASMFRIAENPMQAGAAPAAAAAAAAAAQATADGVPLGSSEGGTPSCRCFCCSRRRRRCRYRRRPPHSRPAAA